MTTEAMSNVIPFRNHHKDPAPWERSFPQGSVCGQDWVVDVLDDLIAFCQSKNHHSIAADLQTARYTAESLLRVSRP